MDQKNIKFRAWHKTEKRMIDWHSKHEDVELMLFTGLEDKNGKEIYEGDIIRCEYTFNPSNAIVRFGQYTQDGSGGEYIGVECIGFYAEAINKNETDEWGLKIVPSYMKTTSLLELEKIEVIGNAFENTSLLLDMSK